MVWTPPAFADRPYARERFAATIKWALDHHPFYQQRFENPAEYIPRLTRPQVAINNDALLAGNIQTGVTSGSTGLPVRIAWGAAKAEDNAAANWNLAKAMGGPLPRARIISLVEQTPDSRDAIDICEPIPSQIAFIEKRQRHDGIRALVTYPTNALLLADWLIEHNRTLDFIERIVLYAEPWDVDNTAQLLAGFPGAKIWSTYSCSELGLVAYTCPHNQRMSHIVARSVGVEVNREGDIPAANGEVGNLVLTDFVNRTAPFIRYEIGDLAIPGVCECGIEAPALEKILGRVRGFLRRADGSRVMFANVSAELEVTPGLRHYQIIQTALDELRFRYVPAAKVDETALQETVTGLLFSYIGGTPRIDFERVDAIERAANGKLHFTICEVAD